MDIKSVTKDYVECASGGTVTAPYNGSWISAYAIALGATEIENGSWLQTLCEQLGITQPVNSSWVIALANYYGITQPVNGSWWYAIADDACNGTIPTPPFIWNLDTLVWENETRLWAAAPVGPVPLFSIDPSTAPAGTTVPDASGNGNDGTSTNVGHDGTYYTFTGTGNNRIEWGDIGDPLSDVTIIQWINVADTNRRSFMFKWNDTIGGAANRSIANEQNGGNWNSYVSTNGGWNGVGAQVTQPGASVWAMMALTYNATTGLQTMTIGDPITSYNSYGSGTATPTSGNPFDSASPWTFGVQPFSTGFNDPFSGSLGHLQVYTQELTTSEIQDVWNATKSYY